MRDEAPNRPVRRGRRGSFTGREKVRRPRKLARMNIVNERRYSFSLKMRKREMKIRMNGMRRVIESWMIGRMKIKIGMKTKMMNRAAREP